MLCPLFFCNTLSYNIPAFHPPKKLNSVCKKTSISALHSQQKLLKTELSKAEKDSILYQKLSPDQLLELKSQEQELEMQRIDAENRREMPLNPAAIVMIVLLPFLFVDIVLVIQGNIRDKDSQRRHDIYLKSLEMGQTVPEHFFDEPQKAKTVSNLKNGILWSAVGLALLIYFIVEQENEAFIVGIVPAFVGVGYILVHFLDKPKNNDEQNG